MATKVSPLASAKQNKDAREIGDDTAKAKKVISRKNTNDHYYSQTLGTRTVTLHIGPPSKSETHTLHLSLLSSSSPFFTRLFSPPFLESQTLTAYLPSDHPIAFRLFISWLYTGHIDKHGNLMKGTKTLWYLIKLYIFAEKYMIDQLCDETMDLFVEAMRNKGVWPTGRMVGMGYRGTRRGSRLRGLLSGIYGFRILGCRGRGAVGDGDDGRGNGNGGEFKRDDGIRNGGRGCRGEQEDKPLEDMWEAMVGNEDLLRDVLGLMRGVQLKWAKGEKMEDPRKMERCVWHVHGMGKKCGNLGRKEM